MNKNTIQGQWTQLKGKVKEEWGKLTNDDLDAINGRSEQLAGRLQERYGYEQAEAQRQVADFEKRMKLEHEQTVA